MSVKPWRARRAWLEASRGGGARWRAAFRHGNDAFAPQTGKVLLIVLYQHSASVLRGRHEAGSDFVWCTCARAIVRRGTARSGRRQFRGSSEGSLRELCSGLRHRVRRRSITLPRRPLCTFQAATGREAAPCGMATVGTGRAFKCATNRVTPSEQSEQPASAGCFLLGENHRGLPKCGADSVSASALKGVLRSCGTNVPRVCYFHNMRRRQEPVPIGEVPCHKRKAFRSIHFSVI